MIGSVMDQVVNFRGRSLTLRAVGEAVGAPPTAIYALSKRLGIPIAEAATHRDIANVPERWIADAFAINYHTYMKRRGRGIQPEEAASKPVHERVAVGSTFGKLRVVAKGQVRGRHREWVCVCVCGGEVLVPGNRLADRRPDRIALLSCGCDRAKRRQLPSIAVGAKLGRLTIRWIESRTAPCGRVRYRCHCDCDCGSKKTVDAGHLQRGRTTSCGCFHREMASRRMKEMRRSARLFELFGEKLTMSELSEVTGVPSGTIKYRIQSGMSVDKAAFG